MQYLREIFTFSQRVRIHAARASGWLYRWSFTSLPKQLAAAGWLKVVDATIRSSFRRLSPRAGGWVVSLYGPLLKTRWSDQTFSYCVSASYGFSFSRILETRRREFSLVDVGANVGIYSLIAAKNRHCQAVLAFEPVAETFSYLESNLQMNSALAVHPFAKAIGASHGVRSISFNPTHSGAASMKPRSSEPCVEVDVVSAEFLRSECLPLLEGDVLLKVDVEGYEDEVLSELEISGLLDRASLVWIEFSETTDKAKCRSILDRTGYRETLRIGSGFHFDVLYER